MDKRRTGLLRMEQFMEKWGLEKPTYNEEDGYFVITFKGPGKPVLNVADERLVVINM